jgi:hypothetical protein
MGKPWCELQVVIDRVVKQAKERGVPEDVIWTEYYEHRREEAQGFIKRLEANCASPWKEVFDNVSFYLQTKPWLNNVAAS